MDNENSYDDEREFMLDVMEGWDEFTEENKLMFEKALDMQSKSQSASYISHIKGVLNILKNEMGDYDYSRWTVITLHDVLENGYSLNGETLKSFFDKFVAQEVSLLVKNADMPMEIYIENMEHYEFAASLIKIKLVSKLYCIRNLKKILSEHKDFSDASILSYVAGTEKHFIPLARKYSRTLFEKINNEIEKYKASGDATY